MNNKSLTSHVNKINSITISTPTYLIDNDLNCGLIN
jgi:hypothetical protein